MCAKPRHGRHRSKTGLKRQSCVVRARVRRAVPKANPSKNTLHMARSRKSRGEVGRLRVSTKQQTIERCVNENNARRPREIDKRSIYSLPVCQCGGSAVVVASRPTDFDFESISSDRWPRAPAGHRHSAPWVSGGGVAGWGVGDGMKVDPRKYKPDRPTGPALCKQKWRSASNRRSQRRSDRSRYRARWKNRLIRERSSGAWTSFPARSVVCPWLVYCFFLRFIWFILPACLCLHGYVLLTFAFFDDNRLGGGVLYFLV